MLPMQVRIPLTALRELLKSNVEEAAGTNTATGATIKVELTDSVSAK